MRIVSPGTPTLTRFYGLIVFILSGTSSTQSLSPIPMRLPNTRYGRTVVFGLNRRACNFSERTVAFALISRRVYLFRTVWNFACFPPFKFKSCFDRVSPLFARSGSKCHWLVASGTWTGGMGRPAKHIFDRVHKTHFIVLYCPCNKHDNNTVSVRRTRAEYRLVVSRTV